MSQIFSNALQIKLRRFYSKLSYIHNPGKKPLRPLTLGKLLQQTVDKHGDRPAIISRHQNKALTYYQVLEQADRLAVGLRNIGLENGDRLGLWAPNCLEWYISKMACARAGLNLVSLNPAYQAREIEYSINKVGIKALICGHKFRKQDYYEILNTVDPELSKNQKRTINSQKLPTLKNIIVVAEENLKGTYNFEEIIKNYDENSLNSIKKHQDHIKIDDPMNVQFTSGSTGHPKAAVISHFQLVNNGYYIGKRNTFDQKHHKICVQVPFFHGYGTVITISAALNHGATLVVPSEGYDPNKNLDAIIDERCSVIHGTPTMYVDLVNLQKERKEEISPEIALSAGAPTSPHLFKEMLRVLNVKTVKSIYGLSETSGCLFQSMVDDDEYKSTATVGYPQEHIEFKVVDEHGNIVPKGVPGELCVRGYCNMLGYFGDEKKTRETMGEDGWLKTGDQFVLEEDGYGRIVGRLKEMIIRGGENIYPKEIEDILNTHPAILETYVIGLPNERLGEEVCACVRISRGSNLTLEDVKGYCKGQMANFKIPSALKIIEELPKTTSGKIQKFKLVEKFKNATQSC